MKWFRLRHIGGCPGGEAWGCSESSPHEGDQGDSGHGLGRPSVSCSLGHSLEEPTSAGSGILASPAGVRQGFDYARDLDGCFGGADVISTFTTSFSGRQHQMPSSGWRQMRP